MPSMKNLFSFGSKKKTLEPEQERVFAPHATDRPRWTKSLGSFKNKDVAVVKDGASATTFTAEILPMARSLSGVSVDPTTPPLSRGNSTKSI
mmetsp:Transcript_44837/g.105142  ORF Transcript_44837/g.105142 Transcript_44837/m.105142 type:complete len:92 (+) Transcript_44837:92-367(+)|eukprot:2559771-Rhodomonas_salina.2